MNSQIQERDRKFRNYQILDSLVGASLCAAAAVGASLLAAGHAWEDLLPLAFVVILVCIALIFGGQAGVWGTVLAALIFSLFLFRPWVSPRVEDQAARLNLAWMVLLGISISFLLAPTRSSFRRR